MKAKKGMGFKKAQSQIAKKQGISKERAGAILAAGARNNLLGLGQSTLGTHVKALANMVNLLLIIRKK